MSEIRRILMSLGSGGDSGGISGLTPYGEITVKRSSSNTLKPSFPVVAGRSMIAVYYDVTSNAYVILYAAFSDDGTRYDYGFIGANGRITGRSANYETQGAEYVTPTISNAIPSQWISGELTAAAPLYLLDIPS